jgi:hypothetical protein
MSSMVKVSEIRKGDRGRLDGVTVEYMSTPMTSKFDPGWGHFLLRANDGRVYKKRLPLNDEVAITSREPVTEKTNKGMK